MSRLHAFYFYSKCQNPSCGHDKNSPGAFLWALPLLQDRMDLNSPATIRGIAGLLSNIIADGDLLSMRLVLRLIPDLNSPRFVKWLSPGHQIIKRMSVSGIRDSDRYLITHGHLDLHVFAAVRHWLDADYWRWSGLGELVHSATLLLQWRQNTRHLSSTFDNCS